MSYTQVNVTNNGKKYLSDVLKRGANNFDIFRLIAALAVIVGHSYAIAPQPPLQDAVLGWLHFDYSGSLAVKFFFFLSGLLVTNSIISNQNPFTFFTKRAFRIFPALLFCLLITVFIIGPIFTKFPLIKYFTNSETWKYIVSNFLLSNMRFRLTGVFTDSKFGLNGSLWTLPYEVLCYIFLAIFYGLGLLKNKIISNIFFVVIILVSIVVPIYLPTFFSQNPDAHLLPACFALGALCANNKNILNISLSNLVMLWLLSFVVKDAVVYQFLFYITFFYTIIYLSSLSFVIKKLKIPFDASYGVYIYGFMFQQCIYAMFPKLGVYGNQIVTAVSAILMGIFSWYFIEKTFINIGHRIANYSSLGELKFKLFCKYFKKRIINYFSNKKTKKYLLALTIILIPVIIFFYFFQWRTKVIFGDDLYLFVTHANTQSLTKQINLSVLSEKYRPIHDIVMHFLIVILKDHFGYYYLFNVLIQTLNTLIFALILNQILKAPFFSLFFSLIIGISRFAFFNIVQVSNGGALEGLAMSFFLLTLYFIVRLLLQPQLSLPKRGSLIIWSIVFANLTMYTHERYLVLFPFIMLLLFVTPNLKALSLKNKLWYSSLIILSISLNIFIKKSIYAIPFFVGTGGTNISLSFTSILGFLKEAILSIFAINQGPIYLTGIDFQDLPFFYKFLSLLLVGSTMLILVRYLRNIWETRQLKQNGLEFNSFILLILLFGLNLAAAVVSIRLEQRWLQASFSIFILLIVLAASKINFKSINQRNFLLGLFFTVFLWIDATYLSLGNKNIYLNGGEKLITSFKDAVDNKTIKPQTERLFIWQSDLNENSINGISSTLVWGDFFTFYQNKKKAIIFVDSVYQKMNKIGLYPLKSFNKNDQILFINNGVVDITDNFIQDSLKDATEENLINLSNKVHYSTSAMTINSKNFDKFLLNGFYNLENNIRWTNGDASISFTGDYAIRDSLLLTLSIYMIPACKNVTPVITLTDINNINYQPVSKKQVDNKFLFSFYFKDLTKLQKINIVSQTIDSKPDLRILSFPFASLDLVNSRKTN